jgi:guanidinoacetate N-methyltransferase
VTRKVSRTPAFEIVLDVHDDKFVAPPRDAQRNWLLNRVVREARDELLALDELAKRFVPGSTRALPGDKRNAVLSDEQIMEDWQVPLMESMAAIASRSHGDVLEIGFGRGVSADMIQRGGVRSHTIIECNASVIARFDTWRNAYPQRDIRLVPGLWQDVISSVGLFDAIFFHTYALDEDEAISLVAGSVTFAAHFFAVAAQHLRPGGVFTYLSNEIDSLGREHQRLLFAHFSSVCMKRVPLNMPPDVRDAWWADSMMVVEAVK